jgi:hypothetical protein
MQYEGTTTKLHPAEKLDLFMSCHARFSLNFRQCSSCPQAEVLSQLHSVLCRSEKAFLSGVPDQEAGAVRCSGGQLAVLRKCETERYETSKFKPAAKQQPTLSWSAT